jgi:hypothetical protein
VVVEQQTWWDLRVLDAAEQPAGADFLHDCNLCCRWGLYNAERMMVKADQLQLLTLLSRKGTTGEVWRGTLWGQPVAVKLVPLTGVDEQQLDCLRREVAVLLHTTGECKQVGGGKDEFHSSSKQVVLA